ncbi:MAG: CDP-alcohol phosphatidyltransferase family protein [Clostridiales bacterium]|nr:CDP-alcohol phosphatidyltransferase family protein [Candidatus Cacconaster stercorequi]
MIGVYDYTVIATYLATALGVIGVFEASDGQIMRAILCLLLAGLLDTFDGRIARTKKGRTEQGKRFGIQIDSLNDLICFGVLPAAICRSVYMSRPLPYGTAAGCGVLFDVVACLFVLAGLIRLAYFNVTEEERQNKTDEVRKYYLGLPITASTLLCPLLYLLTVLLPGATAPILIAGLLITGLMYILPLHIPKPGLKTIICFALIGVAELCGLIYVAVMQKSAVPLQ